LGRIVAQVEDSALFFAAESLARHRVARPESCGRGPMPGAAAPDGFHPALRDSKAAIWKK